MPSSEFKDGVKALPETPDDVYKRTLERISLLDPSKRALALRCLKWLVLAGRPLKIQELLHAVSIKIGNTDIRDFIPVTEENVTAVCAGIVVVDPGTRIVRLAHYTATRYLEQTLTQELHRFHSEIAEICLTYLSFTKLRPMSRTDSEAQARGDIYPFLNYAADYWGHHVFQSAQGQVRRKACEFLEDGAKLAIALQAMSEPRFRTEKGVAGLHMAAYFGLSRLARDMIEKRRRVVLNAQTSNGETAVHWAAFYGRIRVLKVLIDKGADLDTRDSLKRTALHKATMNDDHEAVRIILESKRADTQIEDIYGWTPLRWAASNGYEDLVRMLLQHNDNIDAHDKDGWTALRWAAHKGNNRIVELLIREKASFHSSSQDGWTLLLWAAREGKYEFISLLAKERVPLDGVGSHRETALKEAIRYGHGKAVFALLEAGANVNAVDSKNTTPLHVAVEVWKGCGNKTIVWLLLESGADINAQTKHGFTPLHLAAREGHNLLIWLLLQKGADPSVQDNTGATALHLAAVEGHEELVPSFLLWNEELVTMRNNEGRTALHEAASAGNVKLVAALLQGKSKIDAVDRQGCAALHRAVVQQHEDVVLYLISKNANVDLANKKKSTPLHEAVVSGNKVIIDALLLKGCANKALVNSEGLTPSQLAREYGHDIHGL
ncbi:putative NACHT and Ankyrin domain protein [Rosellinia necatrix]|uniref:Putative NACHT and Ankyrin domain protein n=1 Tax=Rosellinia necatrix TaxID=77044 RepID=A0A1W2TKW9_ROSNE|nr:putative NACHT and Ankyrin domain protein [Rosellinia necatrix]